jgi:hypothetical protein
MYQSDMVPVHWAWPEREVPPADQSAATLSDLFQNEHSGYGDQCEPKR